MNKGFMASRSLSWAEIAALVGTQISEILNRKVSCTAWPEDDNYWGVCEKDTPFTSDEIRFMLAAVDADSNDCRDALPEDSDKSFSIGLHLSSRLLKKVLNAEWKHEFTTDEELFLLDYTEGHAHGERGFLILPGTTVCMNDLKSKQELLNYFNVYGPTHSVLMDFCEPYREKYHNDICWPYPISDGKHLGTFLVPVKEGILSIPYDDADKVDYEIFCLDDIRMFDISAMETLIDDWDSFSTELRSAMLGMKALLMQEVHGI